MLCACLNVFMTLLLSALIEIDKSVHALCLLLDLIDEIQRYTKEKEDLGPFPLQWKALEALN
jgi:hypothetical protein